MQSSFRWWAFDLDDRAPYLVLDDDIKKPNVCSVNVKTMKSFAGIWRKAVSDVPYDRMEDIADEAPD